MASQRCRHVVPWVALLTILACVESARVPDAATRLHEALTPPEGRALPPLATKGEHGLEVAWIVETAWGWDQYRSWVQQRLTDDYNAEPSNSHRQRFQHRTSGAVRFLALVSDGSPNRIRVVFQTPPR